MAEPKLDLGRLFLEEAGRKLSQTFHGYGRPSEESLLKIQNCCGYPQGAFLDTGKFYFFNGKTPEERAVQMLLLQTIQRFGEVHLFDEVAFKSTIRSKMSNISEAYAIEFSERLLHEFRYQSGRGFDESLDKDSTDLPKFRVPMSKRHFIEYQRYSLEKGKRYAPLDMQLVKAPGKWQRFMGLFK